MKQISVSVLNAIAIHRAPEKCYPPLNRAENALLNQALEQKLEIQIAKCQTSETRFQNIVENIPSVVFQTCTNADGVSSYPLYKPKLPGHM